MQERHLASQDASGLRSMPVARWTSTPDQPTLTGVIMWEVGGGFCDDPVRVRGRADDTPRQQKPYGPLTDPATRLDCVLRLQAIGHRFPSHNRKGVNNTIRITKAGVSWDHSGNQQSHTMAPHGDIVINSTSLTMLLVFLQRPNLQRPLAVNSLMKSSLSNLLPPYLQRGHLNHTATPALSSCRLSEKWGTPDGWGNDVSCCHPSHRGEENGRIAEEVTGFSWK